MKLNDLCEIKKGKKVIVSKNKSEGYIPYLLIDTLRGKEPEFYTKDKNYTEAIESDLLMVFDGANSGLVGTGLKGAVGSTIGRIRTSKRLLNNYLTHFLRLNFSVLNTDTKGTAIPHVKPKKLLEMQIRLPETDAQQLIIDEIETQFTRLNIVLKSLNTIKKKLDIYRKSILKAAFIGRLTDNSPYTKRKISDILENVRYGTSKKCNLDQTKTAVLRIPNVVKGFFDDSELKYCQFSDDEFDKLKLKEGDILIIRSNGSKALVGRSAIVTNEFKDYCYAGYLIRLRLKEEFMIPSFFNYFFQSGYVRKQIEKKAKSTSGVNNINAQEIGSMTINVFSIKEQERIVQEIESRFSVIDKIELTVEASLIKAKHLRQSILKSAFEGKLVKYGGDNND